MTPPGVLLVVTGPSGAGKSSIIQRLLRLEQKLSFSVSHTTRAPRPGEQEGVDYRFVTTAGFLEMRGKGAFLESAEVHGHMYGTSFEELSRARTEGRDLLLDIDVQGAAQVIARVPDVLSVFLLPPDFASLEARLRGRRSETESDIEARLANATIEVRRFEEFGYLVVNVSIEQSAADIRAILGAERLRTPRRQALAESILATFPGGAVEP